MEAQYQPPIHHVELAEERLPQGVELAYQIVSFGVTADMRSLLELQKHPLALLVDLGPLDVAHRYARLGAYVAVVQRFGDHVLTYALINRVDPRELKELVMHHIVS
ncbi:MAG: hypothetical protein QXR26_02030 [Candidatus Caldarchaeum sp.]